MSKLGMEDAVDYSGSTRPPPPPLHTLELRAEFGPKVRWSNHLRDKKTGEVVRWHPFEEETGVAAVAALVSDLGESTKSELNRYAASKGRPTSSLTSSRWLSAFSGSSVENDKADTDDLSAYEEFILKHFSKNSFKGIDEETVPQYSSEIEKATALIERQLSQIQISRQTSVASRHQWLSIGSRTEQVADTVETKLTTKEEVAAAADRLRQEVTIMRQEVTKPYVLISL